MMGIVTLCPAALSPTTSHILILSLLWCLVLRLADHCSTTIRLLTHAATPSTTTYLTTTTHSALRLSRIIAPLPTAFLSIAMLSRSVNKVSSSTVSRPTSAVPRRSLSFAHTLHNLHCMLCLSCLVLAALSLPRRLHRPSALSRLHVTCPALTAPLRPVDGQSTQPLSPSNRR